MRKFRLKKGASTYDLMDRSHYFDEPAGLGFAISADTLRAGESFVITDSRQNQKQITGSLIFASYTDYTGFISFIGDNDGIIFGYTTDGSWHEIPVLVTQIEKSQFTTGNYLSCAVTFTALSTWYTTLTYNTGEDQLQTVDDQNIQDTSSNNMMASTSGAHSFTIENGNLSSPIKITIYGPLAPDSIVTWALSDGTSGAWTGELGNSDYLVINADPEELSITKYVGGVASNAYSEADFTTERFLYAPPGTSTLTFSSNIESALVEVKKYELSI